MTEMCPSCGAGLAVGQRFCLNCGARLTGRGPADMLAPASAPDLLEAARPRLPSAASASATLAATLAAGVLIGVGLGPVLGDSAGATQVLVAAPQEPDAPGEDPLTEPPGDLTGSLGAPLGNVEPPPPQQQTAPPPAPPAPAPAPLPALDEPADVPVDPPPDEPPADEPEDEAIAVRGTVVQISEFADSYTIATRTGELLPVHAAELPEVGDAVAGEAEPLANGTFGETRRAKSGTSGAAALRGVVTWASEDNDLYAVSSRGTSILVGRDPQAARVERGSFVKVRVAIGDPPVEDDAPQQEPPAPRLREHALVVESEPVPDAPLEIAAVVLRVDVEAREVVVTVDSADEARRRWPLVAAEELDIESLRPDQALIATLTPRDDGADLLTGWADDSGRRAANDPELSDGDQAP